MSSQKFSSVAHEVIYEKLIKLHTISNNLNLNTKSNNNNQKNKNDYAKQATIYFEIMKKEKDVVAHRIITSHREYIGKLIVFGKKVARKLLKWYINPITEQQTRFNNATVNTVQTLIEDIKSLRLNDENEISKITKLENEISKITKLE
uniref:hypothetical protein n=1 Tax=Anaerophilus nitritogenes TaxID=2498136 RepID=UPI0019310E6C